MQQCQDHLEFQIETPSDQELSRRFHRGEAERLAELNAQFLGRDVRRPVEGDKPRNRKSKQQKRNERNARDAVECEGFEVSPGTGIMSGCDQSAGDCPTCGE